jgi:hypothetical protein
MDSADPFLVALLISLFLAFKFVVTRIWLAQKKKEFVMAQISFTKKKEDVRLELEFGMIWDLLQIGPTEKFSLDIRDCAEMIMFNDASCLRYIDPGFFEGDDDPVRVEIVFDDKVPKFHIWGGPSRKNDNFNPDVNRLCGNGFYEDDVQEAYTAIYKYINIIYDL